MPDKPYDQLNPLDQQIQRIYPIGMHNGTRCTIEVVIGFEKFNTRPYHNYETWGQGYRITDTETGLTVEKEDLDDALRIFEAKMMQEEVRNYDDHATETQADPGPEPQGNPR